jgi:hypothetical protein
LFRVRARVRHIPRDRIIAWKKQDNACAKLAKRVGMKFRDVEQASQLIAQRHGDPQFEVLISRLSDIENQGTIPSIFRIYSLCCIYRLDMIEVLSWYGVPMDSLAADAGMIQVEKTHAIQFAAEDSSEVMLPISLDPGINLRRTFFVSELVQRWGKLPLALLGNMDVKSFRYGFVGTDDWGMYPTILPGSLLVIDDTKRKIQASGWRSLNERPIYFLEHRDAFYCRWCSVRDGMMSLISDPASEAPVLAFAYPGDIEVIGQVIGVAMSLDPEKRRRTRS